MKKLMTYKKHGSQFTQLKRISDIAVFEGVRESGMRTWEVIHIQSHNGSEIRGIAIPASEYPPSDAQWGSKGWTYQNKAAALSRLDSEVNLKNERLKKKAENL